MVGSVSAAAGTAPSIGEPRANVATRVPRTTVRREGVARRCEKPLWVLAGMDHPLPAVPARRHRQADAGPCRIADEMWMWRLRERSVERPVDDEPALGERRSSERDAQSAAYGAAGAVAADEIARAQLGGGSAAGRPHPGAHTVPATIERVEPSLPEQIDAAPLERRDHGALQ